MFRTMLIHELIHKDKTLMRRSILPLLIISSSLNFRIYRGMGAEAIMCVRNKVRMHTGWLHSKRKEFRHLCVHLCILNFCCFWFLKGWSALLDDLCPLSPLYTLNHRTTREYSWSSNTSQKFMHKQVQYSCNPIRGS